MREFNDKTGRKWTIDLPFGTVLRLKSQEGGRFNLLEPLPLAETLVADEAVFWELLWLLVSPQAESQKVGAEQFGDAMAADCLHLARERFFEEWRDFFQSLHRPDKATVVETTARYLAKAMELAQAKASSPEMEQVNQLVSDQMQRKLNESFGELRALLASTPEDSPGGS